MTFKEEQLEKLRNYKEELPNYAQRVFTGEVATGKERTKVVENRVFVFHFKRSDLEDFLTILSNTRNLTLPANRENMRSRIMEKCDSMLRTGICPIESMLYASKTINRMLTDEKLKNILADVITMCIRKDEELCKEALLHIVSNWTWTNQINISIRACGKAGLEDLLEIIYKNYSKKPSYKFSTFAALIDSKNPKFLHYIFEMLTDLTMDLREDKMVKNYLVDNFVANFQSHGVEELNKILSTRKLNSQIQSVIRSIIGSSSEDLIAKAKNNKNIDVAEIFQECKSTILRNQDGYKRLRAYRALGYLEGSDAVGPFLLKQLTHNPRMTKVEQIEAIMTLGFLNYEPAKEHIQLFAKNRNLQYAAYASLMLMGNKSAFEQLIRTFFFDDNPYRADLVFRKIRSRIKTPTNKAFYVNFIKTELKNINHSKFSTFISNFHDIVQYCQDKDYYFYEFDLVIFELFGYQKSHLMNEQAKSIISVKEQNVLLDLLMNVINVNNSHKYLNFLMYIYENSNILKTVRRKAQMILMDESKYPSRPPGLNTSFQ